MAQFDLYRLRSGLLVVDLQTDLIGLDATRLVAPLLEEARYTSFPGITPVVEIAGDRYVVRLQQLSAIEAREIARIAGSLAHLRDELKRGIDILVDGV